LDLSFYAAPNFEKGTAAKELREDKKETADSFSAGGGLLLWPCSTKAYLSGFYEIVFRTVYGTAEAVPFVQSRFSISLLAVPREPAASAECSIAGAKALIC
jgi:hypothetical protein